MAAKKKARKSLKNKGKVERVMTLSSKKYV